MRTLSGGMIRRVGIAQAMLNDPRILVLDEPTAGLDPNERIRFRNLISELSEDRLVLLSTHIVSDVEYVANEIILMKEGKFFYTGTSDEIILSMDMFVWNCIIPKSELNNYMKKYLIGNVRTVSDGVESVSYTHLIRIYYWLLRMMSLDVNYRIWICRLESVSGRNSKYG